MKRRLISLILALAVTVSALFYFNISLALGASETSGYCGSGTLTQAGKNATYTYDATTKTLTISGTGATKDYGTTATNRVPWYDFRSEITTVVVEEGITQLGQLTFYLCSALTNVSLPSTLTTISGGTLDYGAFRECTALASIDLPEGLDTIGVKAFHGCTALKIVKLPTTLTTISDYAFYECTALTSVKFPDSLTSLGKYAFQGCTNLTKVTYGTGMTSTGSYSFYESGLKEVVFSSTITKIDSYSFFNSKLDTIEIPETVTSIEIRAFANCTFLTKATVYSSNCEFNGIIGEDPFNSCHESLTMYGHSGSTTQTYASDKGYNFVSIDPCDHESTHEVITVQPTCTETGVTTQVCDNCGFVVSETQLSATDHLWKVTYTDDETDVDGHIYTSYQCDNCNETKMIISHQAFVDGYYEYTNTATCSKAGIETYTCIVDGCGKVQRSVASKGNHTVESYTVVEEATCTTDGSETGVCTVCGETATRTISATGHTNVENDSLDNTEVDGHTYISYICSVCGEETIVPTHVEWVDGCYTSTVVTDAKCVVNGVRLDTCDICKECGITKTRTVTIPANGQHDWYETTRTEPTCTAVGKIYYACNNCTLTKSENIDALGHDYVLNESSSVSPTCTSGGYNMYYCSVCNASNKDILQATGHTPDETNYTVISEATCEEDGQAQSVCAVCGEEIDIVLTSLGHNMENVSTAIEDKPGHTLTTPTCTRCGQTETASISHDEWLEGYYTTTTTVKGTCTVPEVTRDTCSLCGTTRTNTGTAEGHSYSYARTENNGTLVYSCSICNNEETRTPSSVALAFPQYINTNTADKRLGYVFDLTKDGIINAKDYSMINKAVTLANAYN